MDQSGLIVDVDGTIWDSLPYYAEVLGKLTDTDPFGYLEALRSGESIVTLVTNVPGTGRTGYRDALAHRATELAIYPTVRPTLERAQRGGYRLGILTSLPGWILTPLLAATGIGALFDGVIHASNCRARKPSKAVFDAAVAATGLTPRDRVVFVGDCAADAETASAAGVPFMWAAYGYGSDPPEYKHRAIDQFSEVLGP